MIFVFDFDANRIGEAVLSNDCNAAKNERSETCFGRRELDFLIYNEPESYAKLILTGRMEEYLNTVREGQKF